MKVVEALELIGRVGLVESAGGNLKLKFPEGERTALRPAIETLRAGKVEALALLAGPLHEQRVTANSTQPAQSEVDRACQILNAEGVRIMRLDGRFVIGVWSDLDGPEIRAAP